MNPISGEMKTGQVAAPVYSETVRHHPKPLDIRDDAAVSLKASLRVNFLDISFCADQACGSSQILVSRFLKAHTGSEQRSFITSDCI